MPKTQIKGYTINQIELYSGLYTLIFSGSRNLDKSNIVIKILKSEHPSPDEITRFRHEFEITKEFEHELDIVHVASLEKHDNSFAIVMENISTPTLSEVIEKEIKFNLVDFLNLAIEITTAIGHIHQHNIIHKDINPSNIMCDIANKRIKIIDFGLSANLPKEHAEIVNPNVLEGTLTYLSPEQTGRMNRGIDYRTDFYSLGVTFYQMLTGLLPFNSNDPMELVHYHIAVVPKPPREIDESIPRIVSDIIMKLLSKKAEDRYQNANGLIADLKECQSQLISSGTINNFPLGRSDVFSRFQIPEKLYGRENEVQILLNCYESIAKGKVELMLVSGYSGIGKSALVHEIHKPIVKKHGYFISGKFDQFKKNIPYAAITQAFDEFVKQILTESEERILFFKNKILDALDNNGKIITDVIPNLVSIIGEQQPVAELGPTENQNRFSYVFQNFIKALSGENHPLVIFLDDLQWADLASIKMIGTLLTSPDCRYLLIIGAYRSNEVDSAHPLIMSLDDLHKRNINYQTIELGPLKIEDVKELLSDTLHQNEELVSNFANICYEKTGGNPFFLIQLLLSLFKDQLIEFNSSKNQWVWDEVKIKNTNLSDNVVDLMIQKIKELPVETQKILKYAACIGNTFDLELLSNISSINIENILIYLQDALKEGYIICEGESYRAVIYQFAHDRIQQASDALIEEDERKLIHIKLARLLLQKSKNQKLEELIFDIANHYNIGIEPEIPNFISSEEKIKISDLNLTAAKTAKSAAAFVAALKYIDNSLKCTTEEMWHSHYNFMLELYTEATEIAYLSTQYDLTDTYAAIGLKHAKSILDEFNIIQILVFSNVSQMKQSNAIEIVLKTLKRVGINIPAYPNMANVLYSILKTKFKLIGKKIPELYDLPNMTDPTNIAIVRLITSVISSAYQARPNLLPIFVTTNVLLSLRYGNTKGSAYSYAFYGVISCGVLGEIDKGYQFGALALKLMDKLNDTDGIIKIIFANYAFIKHWKDPSQNSLQPLADNFERGLANGDLEYGCYSILFYFITSYFSGIQLKELLDKIIKYNTRVHLLQQISSFNYNSIYHQTVLNLIEKSDNPGMLVGSAYNENEALPKCLEANDRSALCNIYFNKLILLCIFNKYDEAYQYIAMVEKYIDAIVSTVAVPGYNLYKSLILLDRYKTSSWKDKKIINNKVNTILKNMSKWAKYSDHNFLNKQFLIAAEIYSKIKNDKQSAAQFYDKAISAAKKSNFIQEEALACELAAKFYLSLDNEKIAKVYLEDARHCYLLWGADAKVAVMNEEYSSILNTFASGPSINTSISTSASDRSASQVLDINTIQKSSQAISGTIVLADLLKRLMNIVIENAGAQKSYLLLPKKGQYVIEAEGNVNQSEAEVLKSIEVKSDVLPNSIINYVIHSKESVVLDNASENERFMNDEYIVKHAPKSVLCMPLLNQGKLSGILYMENNLTEGAFTKDRINTLNLLSSQIAISIDNARLYTNTIQLNEQLIVLNKAYERFVPEDFLSLLEKKSITDVELGDQVQEKMSVLFTDIRNFTTLSESMSPEDNFKFINSFLSVMAPVIKKHNGFVDKYIGDAIMALYPRNADDAVQCALEMQASLKEYNQDRADTNRLPISIGIGINTGILMLGTVGEKHRMNATVISDAVNIASRIESLTKTYQAPILISEDTYKSLKNPARFKITVVDDKVLVKGKTKPIAVYKVEKI